MWKKRSQGACRAKQLNRAKSYRELLDFWMMRHHGKSGREVRKLVQAGGQHVQTAAWV
jgi:hypothetical protein